MLPFCLLVSFLLREALSLPPDDFHHTFSLAERLVHTRFRKEGDVVFDLHPALTVRNGRALEYSHDFTDVRPSIPRSNAVKKKTGPPSLILTQSLSPPSPPLNATGPGDAQPSIPKLRDLRPCPHFGRNSPRVWSLLPQRRRLDCERQRCEGGGELA